MRDPDFEPKMENNNVWTIKLCDDIPKCREEKLKIEIPSFEYGEAPLTGNKYG
jgi:hypothetical protein